MSLRYAFITASLTLAASAAVDKECYDYTTEKSCMTASQNGEKCSWCNSAAVGSSCNTETDAQALPSSIFFCEYQAALAASAPVDKECYDYTTEKSCMTASQNGEKCSWCNSAAVGSSCNTQTDAQALPSSIFFCEYQTSSIVDRIFRFIFNWRQ